MAQSYKYAFLTMVKNKSLMFWTLAFPIILGTFFHIAFGSIIKNTESFSQIPAAVVIAEGESDEAQYFLEMIEMISQGDDALILPQYIDLAKAEKLLAEDEIEGIFYAKGGEINLVVSKQGLNQSVLKAISDSFVRISATVQNIAGSRPELIANTIETLSNEIEVNKEIYLGKGETDTMINYFYALLAMTCLYGSLFGYVKAMDIQANKSPLAARRCVSPSKKSAMILADFAAAATIQFIINLVVVAYLGFVLGVNFGEQWVLVALTSLVGSIMGVSLGIFVGSFMKGDESKASGILSAIILFLCFLSGLMYGNMKDVIEQNVPIINRINPAALLSDAYYCLVVYDTYSRYIICIISMLIISILFCAVSAFVLRRKKYASI